MPIAVSHAVAPRRCERCANKIMTRVFPDVGFKSVHSLALVLEVSALMMEGSHLDSDECGTFGLTGKRAPKANRSLQADPMTAAGPGSAAATPVSPQHVGRGLTLPVQP